MSSYNQKILGDLPHEGMVRNAMAHSERGEGKLKLVVTLAAIAAVFFVAFKFIPVKVQNSTLEDCIVEEEKFAGELRRTQDVIRDNIWQCAVDNGLEDYFDRAEIKVDKSSNSVRVRLNYERPVELPGYTYIWRFDIDMKRALY